MGMKILRKNHKVKLLEQLWTNNFCQRNRPSAGLNV